MDNYETCSDRTKRRKLSAKVKEILRSIEEENREAVVRRNGSGVRLEPAAGNHLEGSAEAVSDSQQNTADLHTGGDRGKPEETPTSVSSSDGDDRRWEHMEGLLLKAVGLLEDMRETQLNHGRLLESLLQKTQPEATGRELPTGVSFPIRSMEEFDSVDGLLQDPSVFTGVVSCVSDLGGRTIEEGTRRMMGHVLTNHVSLQFNVVGRHGKRAFGSTQLFELVYRALKKNSMTSAINRKEYERAVSKWLTNGRDRDGNRAKRVLAGKRKRVVGDLPLFL